MKKLFILRHAKSSWDQPDLADFDRPLNHRGLIAAPFMGELIARKKYLPDVIISSPAKRARQTALLIKEAAGAAADIRYEERIYEASPQALKQIVSELDEDISSVMIVGHNPGIEGFIKYLTGRLEAMPTAALASIKLDLEKWSNLSSESGDLEEVVRPKEAMTSL
ncbi:MAG: histidine phosphatase family protein [Saprospiraceae bacterium]|nr:histidine phosphatase family protein [Pyrinomonadaceae bacterium]